MNEDNSEMAYVIGAIALATAITALSVAVGALWGASQMKQSYQELEEKVNEIQNLR